MKPFSTIKAIRCALQNSEITPEQVLSFYRDRCAQYNPELNALLEVYDVAPDAFNPDQPLSCIPGVIKDNIACQDKAMSCGSRILSNYVAPYSATVVQRMRKAGAVIFGRANMDEFAMGASGEYSAWGPTKNPWDSSRVPGGSSSGSAAAVAAGLVPWALGSETGGSVRQPASFCGLVGMYPTYGLVSRYGLTAFTSSTDQVGPITRTVFDNALVFSELAGHDERDSTSLDQPTKDYTRCLEHASLAGVKVGVLKEAIESEGMNQQVRAVFVNAIKELERQGAIISYITIPSLDAGVADYFVVSRAEAASNLARFDGSLYGARDKEATSLSKMYENTRHDGFGPEVTRRILMGNYLLSAEHKGEIYSQAVKVRQLLRAGYAKAFESVDLIFSPTVPTLPFKLEEGMSDPMSMYLADYFTVPNCIAGLPGISFNAGFSQEGLPIGVQFVGPALSEAKLYQAAYCYEQATEHYKSTPKHFGGNS